MCSGLELLNFLLNAGGGGRAPKANVMGCSSDISADDESNGGGRRKEGSSEGPSVESRRFEGVLGFLGLILEVEEERGPCDLEVMESEASGVAARREGDLGRFVGVVVSALPGAEGFMNAVLKSGGGNRGLEGGIGEVGADGEEGRGIGKLGVEAARGEDGLAIIAGGSDEIVGLLIVCDGGMDKAGGIVSSPRVSESDGAEDFFFFFLTLVESIGAGDNAEGTTVSSEAAGAPKAAGAQEPGVVGGGRGGIRVGSMIVGGEVEIAGGRSVGTSRGGGITLMGLGGRAALASSFIRFSRSFNGFRISLKAGRSSAEEDTQAMAMDASSGGVSGGNCWPNVSN